MRYLFAACLMLLASPAAAQKTANCLTETASVSVNFNYVEADVNGIRGKFEGRMNEIKNLSKEAHLDKIDLQSMNYNVSPDSSNGNGPATQYRVSGSISFTVLPANGALDFLALLTKKGYQANANVNSYRSGNICNNQPTD